MIGPFLKNATLRKVCIILLQLGALLYGGMIIYPQHPAFVVFGVDRSTTIPAAEVEFNQQLQYPELQRRAGIGLLLAQTRPPADRKTATGTAVRRRAARAEGFGISSGILRTVSARPGAPALAQHRLGADRRAG
jgi:hypothetical protein